MAGVAPKYHFWNRRTELLIGARAGICYNSPMNGTAEQYRCRQCDNVSWREEVCHDVSMEPTCFCGSGEFLTDCHDEPPPEEPLSDLDKAAQSK